MPPSDRHQQPLRLPRDVAAKAHRQAGRRGISFNAYVLSALEAKLKDDREQAEDRPARKSDRDAPQGLALSRTRRPEPELVPSFAEETSAPVVVNVNPMSSAAGQGSLLEGLASFVMGGPSFSRDQRKRQAQDVIKGQDRPAAEREKLAEQLEALLKERKAQQARSLGGGVLGSLFR